MTDELVNRLRWAADNSNFCGEWNCNPDDLDSAADEITRLQGELLSMALDCLATHSQAIEAHEAKLAAEKKLQKAIDALEKVQVFARDLEPYVDQGHTLVPALREACEVLAELKEKQA